MGADRPLVLAQSTGRSPLELLRDESPDGRSPGSFLVSAAIHGGILLALLFLAQKVVPLPAKATTPTVVPVELLGGGGARPPKLGQPRDLPRPPVTPPPAPVTRTRPAIVAPSEVTALPEPVALLEAGDPTGVEDGVVDGIRGSWGDGPAEKGIGGPGLGEGAGEGDGAVTGIGEPPRVTNATLVHRVEPVYPKVARGIGLEGTVVLDAVIDENGDVIEVRPLNGHPVLVDSAVKAVRQWRFQPAMIGGRASRVLLTVSVSFRIER